MPVVEEQDLKNMSPLGSGSSAIVFKATWHNAVVAVKQMKVPMEYAMDTMVTELGHEIVLWSQLSYPYIVQFFGVTRKLWLVMDYMEHGTLADVVTKNEMNLSEEDVVVLMWQASRGMEYLHARSIIHRDLNPNNIMITGPRTKLVAKLADFGLSRVNRNTADLTRTKSVGTPMYSAPEVLDRSLHSFKSDVFSFGMSLWFAIKRKHPFLNAHDFFDLRRRLVTEHERPEPVDDPALQKIISWCWDDVPNSRPTFRQVSADLEAYLKDHGRGQDEE